MSEEIEKLTIEQLSSELAPIQTKSSRKLSERECKLAVLMAGREMNGMTIGECYKLAGIKSTSHGAQIREKEAFKRYMVELLESWNKEQMGLIFKTLHDLAGKSKSEKIRLEAVKVFFQITGQFKQELSHTVKVEDEIYDPEKKRKELLDSMEELDLEEPTKRES